MRNPKTVALLVLSVIIGLGATIVAAGWISQQGQVASAKVVVAAGDIQLGSRLTAQMLNTVDWPSGSIPPWAIRADQSWKALSQGAHSQPFLYPVRVPCAAVSRSIHPSSVSFDLSARASSR